MLRNINRSILPSEKFLRQPFGGARVTTHDQFLRNVYVQLEQEVSLNFYPFILFLYKLIVFHMFIRCMIALFQRM